jgi:hypothetical protein
MAQTMFAGFIGAGEEHFTRFVSLKIEHERLVQALLGKTARHPIDWLAN